MNKTKNIYNLPFKKDLKIKPEFNLKVHKGSLKYAIDFCMSIGTKILAAASGKVIAIKVDSNKGGLKEKYKKNPKEYMNKIEILHGNGEISGYYHLKQNGSFVKVGDRVQKGQIIGLSGNTGYSSEPHLHFMVIKKINKKPYWRSLKIRFK